MSYEEDTTSYEDTVSYEEDSEVERRENEWEKNLFEKHGRMDHVLIEYMRLSEYALKQSAEIKQLKEVIRRMSETSSADDTNPPEQNPLKRKRSDESLLLPNNQQ